jgi:hypothetical protein
MIVQAQVAIDASRAAVWAAICDIEHAAAIVRGIEKIEIVDRPAHGLVGLRWRETRMLFGDPAVAEKWITDAADNTFYRTRAEDLGFAFVTTRTIAEHGGCVTLSESHESIPLRFAARLKLVPMILLFQGTIRKAVLQDLDDIKAAVERQAAGSAADTIAA